MESQDRILCEKLQLQSQVFNKDNQLCVSAKTSALQGDKRGTRGVWGN